LIFKAVYQQSPCSDSAEDLLIQDHIRRLSRADIDDSRSTKFPLTAEEEELYRGTCLPTLQAYLDALRRQCVIDSAVEVEVTNFHGGGTLRIVVPCHWFAKSSTFVRESYQWALGL
jgi:hypothetical protein